MNVRFEDMLEPVGILGGLFIIVIGLVSLLEAPWTTSLNSFVAAVQIVGIALTVLVGLGLIWLSYTGDALPGGGEETSETDQYTATVDSDDSTTDDHDTTTADDDDPAADDEEFGVTLDETEDE